MSKLSSSGTGTENQPYTVPTDKKKNTPFVISSISAGLAIIERFSPEKASNLATKLFLRPLPAANYSQESAKILALLKSRRIKSGINTITTYSKGDGPVVILQHGWSGCAQDMCSFIKPLLDKGFQVVTFDSVAHGDSDGKSATLPDWSEAINSVAADCTGEIHAIIAHSFGAMCSLHAVANGLNIKRLVCISPPINMQSLLDKFQAILKVSDRIKSGLIENLKNRFGSDIKTTFSSDYNVQKLSTPVLIFHDRHDTYVDFCEGEQLSNLCENCEFIATSKLGHRRILNNDDVVNKTVQFISQLH